MKTLITVMILLSISTSTVHAQESPSLSGLFAGLNQVRANAGLAPLAYNGQLSSSAYMKASDMCTRNYWSHGDYANDIRKGGYQYTTAGENLSQGYNTTDGIIQAWVNSPSHYRNMVDPNFKDAGLGMVTCPSYQGKTNVIIVANHFGASVAVTPKRAPAPVQAPASKPAAPVVKTAPVVQPPAPQPVHKEPEQTRFFKYLNSVVKKDNSLRIGVISTIK